MDYNLLEKSAIFVRGRLKGAARAALILGSGWGGAAAAFEAKDSIDYSEIPGLGATGIEGHSGKLLLAELSGVPTLVFQGRRHWYEGEGWTPIAAPIYIAKVMGVSNVVLSNAAGGIADGFAAGDLMLITGHINMMGVNPLIGKHNPIWGPRFPDMSSVYSPRLQDILRTSATSAGITLREGVYAAMSGPSFETPAEIRMLKAMGAHAVGMSTVPEAILATAAGMNVLGVSCISNLAAGISKTPLTHEEVFTTIQDVMPGMRRLFEALWQNMAARA